MNLPPMTWGGFEDTIWMDLTLEWTHCEVHRVGTGPGMELVLGGEFASSHDELMVLSTCLPETGAYPNLYFVEDIFGRSGSEYGEDVQMTWEISLDGAEFTPFSIMPDGSLCFQFPAGVHRFEILIRGELFEGQPDGYYQLQAVPSFIPIL